MKKFARLSPRRYGKDELPTRIEQLSRGTYLAVQQTLENVWFGAAAPLKQACEHVRVEYDEAVDEDEVTRVLAEFIDLLVRKVVFPGDTPESLSALRNLFWVDVESSLCGIIGNAPTDIERLRSEVDVLSRELTPLRSEVLEKDRLVKNFRERKKDYERSFENYQRRVQVLEIAEARLTALSQAIEGIEPLDESKLAAVAEALRQNLERKG